jgi:hypothetical protein
LEGADSTFEEGATMTKKELMDEVSRGIVWRPKLLVKNPRYPKVTAKGCKFAAHGNGFILTHRKTGKYLGFYTKADIAELEKQYYRKPRRPRLLRERKKQKGEEIG